MLCSLHHLYLLILDYFCICELEAVMFTQTHITSLINSVNYFFLLNDACNMSSSGLMNHSLRPKLTRYHRLNLTRFFFDPDFYLRLFYIIFTCESPQVMIHNFSHFSFFHMCDKPCKGLSTENTSEYVLS